TYFNVKEGMKVAFRINQVRLDEGRVRGKIIKIIH
ncbi:RNA-binding protein, partial [Turicibacter sanguinis]|nr:RNA-binding protein [Turicibacter sanguinis]